MTTRADIVATARSYIGTPYSHQGRMRGIGLDCGGLILQVGKELQLLDWNTHPNYGRKPNGNEMAAMCGAHLDIRAWDDRSAGNIGLFAFLGEPQHLGIFTGDGGLIHVYMQARRCVEHRLDDEWESRLRLVYSYRGVSDG